MKKLILVLLLLMPAFACAGVTVETISEANGKMATNRYTFSQELPDVLLHQLERCGVQDVNCVSGLCIERLVLEYPKGQENAYRSSDALLILEKDGGYTLAGMQWSLPENPVYYQEYGSLGLSLDKGFQLQFASAPLHTADYQLTAQCSGTLRSWRINVTGQNVWYVAACETPSGETVRWKEFDGAFELDDGLHYACWWPQLEGMATLDEFPVTHETAAALARSSWAGLPVEKLAVIGGNLREEPTSNSRSLGLSQGAVLAEMLDERPGVYEPWIQVRVGETFGWVSSTYVKPLCDGTFDRGLLQPLKQAVVKEATSLRRSPEDQTLVQRLDAGTELQVLHLSSEGWLHVVVPGAKATRCMDINGIYGYVRLDEVETEGLNLHR